MEKRGWIVVAIIFFLLCVVLSVFSFIFYTKVINCESDKSADDLVVMTNQEVREQIDLIFGNDSIENNSSS